MPVPREQQHPAPCALAEHFVKPRAFLRHGLPRFVIMRVGDDLDRRNDEAKIGGLRQFLAQPRPLLRAEHRHTGPGIGPRIRPQRRAILAIRAAIEIGAEETRVEQDHLHALARLGPDRAAFIDAGARTDLGARIPERLVDLFRQELEREARSAIVEAVIVIVPGRQHRNVAAEAREFWMARLFGIAAAQIHEARSAIPALVAIDVIPDQHEQLRVLRRDLRPHMLAARLMVAASEGESGQRSALVQRHALRRARQRRLARHRGIIGGKGRAGRRVGRGRGAGGSAQREEAGGKQAADHGFTPEIVA